VLSVSCELLFIYYAACAATNRVKYAYANTKITKITKKTAEKNTINVHDMQAYMQNMAQVACCLILLTEQYGSFIE